MKINYTKKSYEDIQKEVIEFIKRTWPTTFNDYSANSIIMMLIDVIVYVTTMIFFAINQVANEIFLDTAEDKANVVRMLRLIGYELSSPTSAQVECVLTFETLRDNLIIDAGTSVKVGKLPFELVNPVTIASGEHMSTITMSQGETKKDTIIANGQVHQEYKLLHSPVIIDSTFKVAVNNVDWTKVEFLDENDAVNVFQVSYNENYEAIIKFGDNLHGNIPPEDAIILATYRVGGGVAGNIAIGAINQTITGRYESNNQLVTLKIRNDDIGYNGTDAETIEYAKKHAPKTLRGMVPVSRFDMVELALKFTSTTGERAVMAKAGVDKYWGAYGIAFTLGTVDTLGVLRPMSQGYITEFIEHMQEYYMLLGMAAEVYAFKVKTVDFNISVKIQSHMIQKDAMAEIKNKIQQFMSVSNRIVNNPNYYQDVNTDDIDFITYKQIVTLLLELQDMDFVLHAPNDNVYAPDKDTILILGSIDVTIEGGLIEE